MLEVAIVHSWKRPDVYMFRLYRIQRATNKHLLLGSYEA